MLLFLLLLLPISLGFFLFSFKEQRFQPVLIIGSLTGILVCIIRALFVFSHRIIPNSLPQNYRYFLLNESFLPQLILYGLYFIIAKDELDLKLKSYFPLVCSFYVFYLPYVIISANESEVYSGFAIFAKPAIYLAMLAMCEILLLDFSPAFTTKLVRKIVAVPVILVYLLVPALLESFYVMNLYKTLLYVLTIIYILFPAVFFFVKKLVKK